MNDKLINAYEILHASQCNDGGKDKFSTKYRYTVNTQNKIKVGCGS